MFKYLQLIGIVAQASLTMLEPLAQVHISDYFPEITDTKMGRACYS